MPTQLRPASLDPCGRSKAIRFLAGVVLILLVSLTQTAQAQVSPGPLSRSHSSLEGNLNCLKCHQGGSSALARNCLACHGEISRLVREKRGLHGRQPDKQCVQCHPEHAGVDFELIDWGEEGLGNFDHGKVGWSLAGKHLSIRCRDCHQRKYQQPSLVELFKKNDPEKSWLGLEGRCVSCHIDIHQGTLEAPCVKCHGAEGWKPASRFDHAETDYPLSGAHIGVPCGKCHLPPAVAPVIDPNGLQRPRYRPVPHQNCSDCHQDPHSGQLGADCQRCHVVQSFKDVKTESFDHARTRYPLRGRHVSLKCEQCHDPNDAWGKKPRFDVCRACHSDPHAGKATLKGGKVDCASCHGVDGFRPSTYTVEQHATSAYPLQGKHRTVRCEACHTRETSKAAHQKWGPAGVRIRRPHEKCRSCHDKAHAGQLEHRPDQGACESCHGLDGWKPSAFTAKQHAQLKFPLKGRHADLTCASCHGPTRPDLPPLPGPRVLGSARVALTTIGSECVDCHRDPHQGRYSPGGARPQKGGCQACHRPEAFRPARLDVEAHAKFAFALEGAHRAVPCEGCHSELKEVPSSKSLLQARGAHRKLSFQEEHQECEDCHENPHGGQFNGRKDRGACQACHDLSGFRPASRFDHVQYSRFPLDGSHRKVACERCHLSRKHRDGRKQTIYRSTPRQCEACHAGKKFKKMRNSGSPR